MAGLDVGDSLIGMELEEFLASGRTAQAAQHAELAVMNVGYVGAPVLARGLWIELENVREKAVREFIINVLRVRYEIFFSLTES